ncbi:MAG: hypothetical protein AAF604_05485 [Acidobacteriota bacterium]
MRKIGALLVVLVLASVPALAEAPGEDSSGSIWTSVWNRVSGWLVPFSGVRWAGPNAGEVDSPVVPQARVGADLVPALCLSRDLDSDRSNICPLTQSQ